MGGWAGSRRREEMPKDWKKRRAAVRARSGGRCEWISRDGVRCTQRAVDVDHWEHRENHGVPFLRDLCKTHHGRKTGREARAGKRAVRRKGERKRHDDRPGAL